MSDQPKIRSWAGEEMENDRCLKEQNSDAEFVVDWSSDSSSAEDSRDGKRQQPAMGSKKKLHNISISRLMIDGKRYDSNTSQDSTADQESSDYHTADDGTTSEYSSLESTNDQAGEGQVDDVHSESDRSLSSNFLTSSAQSNDESQEYDSTTRDLHKMWVLHKLSDCTPCLFVHTQSGCRDGADCKFCHLYHNRSRVGRSLKGKRERFKRYLAASQIVDIEVE